MRLDVNDYTVDRAALQPQRYSPNLDEQHRKVDAAQAQLDRYERLSRIALLLVLPLAIVLLALVVSHLRGQP